MKIVLRMLSLLCFLVGGGLLIYHFTQPAERVRVSSDNDEPGKLEWEPPTVRKTLMTFAYKVFGNKDVETGRFFTARLVLKNRGKGPVRDVSVSYQIPEYLAWSTPENWPDLPPDQTVISTYYPQLPAKVTELANQTSATLEIKIKWSDVDGKPREEVLSHKFEFRGVNEIEYSDLPKDDILTWHDNFNCAPFVVSMVTPNDPVVKEYASQISLKAGGSMAGVHHTEATILELMKATYQHMQATGMQYSGAKGVPAEIGDASTFVQTVRLPRNVILNNTGLCIELATLWASILEHLGVETTIAMIPGHAFIVAHPRTPEGEYGAPLAIECTCITPKAVGAARPVTFDEAVTMGGQELVKARDENTLIGLNIRDYQKAGFVPPELPEIDLDKIKTTLAMRTDDPNAIAENNGNNNNNIPPDPDNQDPPPDDTATENAWIHPNKLMAIPLPEGWKQVRSDNPPVGQIFVAQNEYAGLFVEGYQFAEAASVEDGFAALMKSLPGLEIGDKTLEDGKLVFNGSYKLVNDEGAFKCVMAQTRGGACAALASALKVNYTNNTEYLANYLKTVEFTDKK